MDCGLQLSAVEYNATAFSQGKAQKAGCFFRTSVAVCKYGHFVVLKLFVQERP
jgi:hypothetical protein